MQVIPDLNPICINCMVNSRLNQYPENISDATKAEYMMRVLTELAQMKNQQDPTIATTHIIEIQKEMFGWSRDYSKLKSRFNQFVMQKEAFLQSNIEKSEDSLKLAIQYAIVGNLIDFIVMDSVDENRLEKMFAEASEYVLKEETYQSLKQDVLSGNKIVLLLDNCGEIVVDKLLIQVLKKLNPNASITAIVRGEEALNDATMEDAIQVGLTDVVRVIGNGTNYPGTCLQLVSDEARSVIEEADVILSKGQGNLETFQGSGLNTYYIFLCKCEMIAEKFGVEKFTPMLVREKL